MRIRNVYTTYNIIYVYEVLLRRICLIGNRIHLYNKICYAKNTFLRNFVFLHELSEKSCS